MPPECRPADETDPHLQATRPSARTALQKCGADAEHSSCSWWTTAGVTAQVSGIRYQALSLKESQPMYTLAFNDDSRQAFSWRQPTRQQQQTRMHTCRHRVAQARTRAPSCMHTPHAHAHTMTRIGPYAFPVSTHCFDVQQPQPYTGQVT
jgi:hypothetical protein